MAFSFSLGQLDDGVGDGGAGGRHLLHHHKSAAVNHQHVTGGLGSAPAGCKHTARSNGVLQSVGKTVDGAGITSPLCGGGVPVIEGTTQHGVFARLQHDVAAHKPPHGSPAVSQQAAHGQGAGAVEGDPEHQQAQVQQVALCCVPAPDGNQEKAITSRLNGFVPMVPAPARPSGVCNFRFVG